MKGKMFMRKRFLFMILLIVILLSCTDNFLLQIKEKIEKDKNPPVPTYSVIYDGNGNDSGNVPEDTTEYREGDTVTVLGNTSGLEKSGYVFVGWNTEADGSGTEYIEGDTFTMGEEDITLYAHWVIEIVKLLAPDGGDNWWFGYSVAMDGNYLAIGCSMPYLYIFQRTNYNTWDTGTSLNAAGSRNVVAINGDYVVSGSKENDSVATDAGVAKIFHKTDLGWGSGVTLVASDGAESDYFGCSVSISGNYAVIGASGEDEKGTDAGAAYIFHRIGTNAWDTGVKLLASDDGAAGDSFGCSVSINGDYVVIGATGADTTVSDTGAVYVFHRTGTNAWEKTAKLVAPDGETDDRFGTSVAIDGDYAIVGAMFESSKGYRAGAAYVFYRDTSNGWDSGTQLLAPDGQPSDYFGRSVAIEGNYIVVGAEYNDNDNGKDSGAVYIFARTGVNKWEFIKKITAPDGVADDWFGKSVSISGSYVIGGAYHNNESGSLAGAVYIKLFE